MPLVSARWDPQVSGILPFFLAVSSRDSQPKASIVQSNLPEILLPNPALPSPIKHPAAPPHVPFTSKPTKPRPSFGFRKNRISPNSGSSRRRGFRSGVLNSRPQPRAEFCVEVTKLPSLFPNFLPRFFVLTSAPNLQRKCRPRFCVACLPQDRPSSNSSLGEFAMVLSCSQYPSRRKPSFLVPSPPSPASSAL